MWEPCYLQALDDENQETACASWDWAGGELGTFRQALTERLKEAEDVAAKAALCQKSKRRVLCSLGEVPEPAPPPKAPQHPSQRICSRSVLCNCMILEWVSKHKVSSG